MPAVLPLPFGGPKAQAAGGDAWGLDVLDGLASSSTTDGGALFLLHSRVQPNTEPADTHAGPSADAFPLPWTPHSDVNLDAPAILVVIPLSSLTRVVWLESTLAMGGQQLV